jgi:hypothetical protein
MITHMEELIDGADRIFQATIKDGVTSIETK